MSDHASISPLKSLPDLNEFRGYLRAIAVLQLGCRLQAKLDASDVVQQTIGEAYRDLPQFKGQDEAQLKAWLRQILSNNLKGVFREWNAQRRNPKMEVSIAKGVDQSSYGMDQFLAAEQTSPSQQAVRNELYEQLADALLMLPEEQRMAVILKHFEGWPLAEIAQEMNKSTSAVGGLLKRGLKGLRQSLSPENST